MHCSKHSEYIGDDNSDGNGRGRVRMKEKRWRRLHQDL